RRPRRGRRAVAQPAEGARDPVERQGHRPQPPDPRHLRPPRQTHEGRLQVELAQLEYQLPRLTRLWTHLSRTGGGIGTRGPGESQLETDRRIIRTRISKM